EDDLRQVVAEVGVVEADAEAIQLPTGEHALTADAKAIELLENIGVPIAKANPAEDADALRTVRLRRIQELIEVIVGRPRARRLADLDLAEGVADRDLAADDVPERDLRAQILGERRVRLAVPAAADQLVPGQAEGLDPHPELPKQHHSLLEQLV